MMERSSREYLRDVVSDAHERMFDVIAYADEMETALFLIKKKCEESVGLSGENAGIVIAAILVLANEALGEDE